jgi:hypothetical protein
VERIFCLGFLILKQTPFQVLLDLITMIGFDKMGFQDFYWEMERAYADEGSTATFEISPICVGK